MQLNYRKTCKRVGMAAPALTTVMAGSDNIDIVGVRSGVSAFPPARDQYILKAPLNNFATPTIGAIIGIGKVYVCNVTNRKQIF